MEEAAQILEVETLIPMLLQDTDPVTGCRLRRAVLIGDHNQLPPVVKHQALQRFCRLDQSLFARFVRLGVPAVQLDRQGRARAEIAALYSWRYNGPGVGAGMGMGMGAGAGSDVGGVGVGGGLGNLPNVLQRADFLAANPGLLHTMQFVDVGDFQGRGEACPTPHFYQNLGEAEYVVAVYQYMRLLGYPASSIAMLTTYNGQRELLQDVVARRCSNPLFGPPAAISTVDKFQGQQAQYVLLSLVRTEAVGHLRDVRRLVVALSRARLGMYVFGRRSLFQNCYELSQAFAPLLARPAQLQLVAGEAYAGAGQGGAPTARPAEEGAGGCTVHDVEGATAMGVLVYQMVQQTQASQVASQPMQV
jgi:intron-binding protein aquarius